MTTQQNDAATMTEAQLDAVAGGVMPDENGRPFCIDPRWCFPIPFPSFPFPAPKPREGNDGTTRGRR